jgi:hypothetical protein
VVKRRHNRPATVVHRSLECPMVKTWLAQGGVAVPVHPSLIDPAAPVCGHCP